MDSNSNLELKPKNCEVSIKNPKRILHFSDGILEEYSDSEESEKVEAKTEDVVDTTKMGWGPWLMYKALQTGNSTLAACDYVGEALASFLGITTPKYQYELDEYLRLQKQRQAIDAENNANGWLNNHTNVEGNDEPSVIIETHPTSSTNMNINQ